MAWSLSGKPGTEISGLPHRGVAMFKGEAGKAIEFCEQMLHALEPYQPGQCSFDNIDISGVAWPTLSLQVFLEIIGEKICATKRLKAYKCGLTDEAIGLVANYLEALPAKGMPEEIHLSHNNMTETGFQQLFTVIERKRAELATPMKAVWLRIESNQVAPSITGDLCDQGKIALVPKCNSPAHRACLSAVAAMPSFPGPGSSAPTGAGKGASKGSSTWAPPIILPPRTMQALPGSGAQVGAYRSPAGAASWGSKDTGGNSGGRAGQNGWDSRGGSKDSWDKKEAWWASTGQEKKTSGWDNQAWSGGQSAGSDHDRSRSPAHKVIQSAHETARMAAESIRQARVAPTPVLRRKLPEPWSEEWSEEYGIPYYWNKESGDSVWELESIPGMK